MIVQTAPEGAPNLIIQQARHARLSGRFAEAYGNEEFSPVTPRDPMVYVASHHDEGWLPIDALMEQDAETGLPYNLTQTPLPYLLVTSAASPAFNEAYHPYSGIISSMHSYGLFNGRYGLSDEIFIDMISEQQQVATEEMLRHELDRQERLIYELHLSDEFAIWINEARLFHNYKLLQFFDTLALYFQMNHPITRAEAEFLNVPRTVGDDVTITITPIETGTYKLSPYPFQEDTTVFDYEGRFLSAQPAGTNLAELWEDAVRLTETIKLVRN